MGSQGAGAETVSKDVVKAVVIDDHDVVRAGIRSWCAAADPPIEVVEASDRASSAWVGPGADADVVILDLQLSGNGVQEFGHLRRLAEAGRRVVVYTRTSPATPRCAALGWAPCPMCPSRRARCTWWLPSGRPRSAIRTPRLP